MQTQAKHFNWLVVELHEAAPALIVQRIERKFPKLDAAGSNPARGACQSNWYPSRIKRSLG